MVGLDEINLEMSEIMGIKISEIRRRRKISQKELAEKLGITRSHLSRVETGKVKASTRLLERIAKELNCSMKDFF